MAERGGDFPLVQTRSIIAVDRERDPATLVEMTRPSQGTVEGVELFIEK